MRLIKICLFISLLTIAACDKTPKDLSGFYATPQFTKWELLVFKIKNLGALPSLGNQLWLNSTDSTFALNTCGETLSGKWQYHGKHITLLIRQKTSNKKDYNQQLATFDSMVLFVKNSLLVGEKLPYRMVGSNKTLNAFLYLTKLN